MNLETWKTPDLDECDPGIQPTEYRCLVAMAEKLEKTNGGILLPDAVKDKAQWGSDHARLVAISPLAFTYEKDWSNARKPEVGDEVFVGRYPGEEIVGKDGRTYRLCEDRTIGAVIVR